MIEKICFIISLFLILVLFGTLILSSSENNYHFAYLDENNNLGVSARCRNYQCETLDFTIINVKDYIDIREK